MVRTILDGLKRFIMTFCTDIKHSVFRNYPPISFTETKTEAFQRNNCTGGQNGSWVDYSKTYTSYISELDLQRIIAEDEDNFNSAGQANANANGSCSVGCTAKTVSGSAAYPARLVGLSDTYLYATSRTVNSVFRYPLSVINSSGNLGTLSAMSNSDYSDMLFPTSSELVHKVSLFSNGSNYLMDVYYISPSPNACQGPINKYTNLSRKEYLLDYKLLYHGLGNSLNGMIYVTSAFSADNDVDIYFKPDTGAESIIATITAPTPGNKKYKFYQTYVSQPNNEEVYITFLCKTSSSSNGSRILVYRVTKDFFGTPVGVEQIYNSYTNQVQTIWAAGWVGDVFGIFYTDKGSSGVFSIGSPAISNPGRVNSFVSRGVNAYVVTDSGLKRYNLGSWTTLYSY